MQIYYLLDEIQASAAAKLYRVALFTALTFPDIAGAIDSEDGRASGKKYAQWFDAYVAQRYYAWKTQYLTGTDCYQYRCALLHQGRSQHDKSRYSKTVFLHAKQENIAYCGAFTIEQGTTLCVDIAMFCNNIVDAGYQWLENVDQSERFMRNTTDIVDVFTLSFG